MKRKCEIIEKQEIKNLYVSGKSPESIAKIYPQYSAYTIREFLRDNNLLKSAHVITDDIFIKMLIDYKKGMTFADMSKKYGYHPVCIGKKIKKHGVNTNIYYPKISKQQVLDVMNEMGLKLLKDLSDDSINSQTLYVYDSDGYKYVTTWTLLRQKHKPLKYSPNNPYSIENINLLLNETRNGEYYCPLNQEYKGNNEDLIFIHKPCGKSFVSSLVAMQGRTINSHYQYTRHCRYYYPKKIESTHASVLKQVFIHEYPTTEVEERSCINPNTNRVLPTDIVNHDLKIAIEIQSDYHDAIDKQKLDKIKKDYWINRGYNFYDPDIRNYNVLEMIQLFFPSITKIPDYIDYHYSDVVDFSLFQKELNKGKTIKEITKEYNLSQYTLHNAIARGVLILPDDSKRKAWNVKGLVHLSKDGEFIKEYSHLNDVSEDNYALGTIQRVLSGKQKFAYNSYWVYSKDYYENNYAIPKEESDRYLVPIVSVYDGIEKHYSDIYKASEEIKCHPCDIYRVLKGDRKSFKGYQFKYNQ